LVFTLPHQSGKVNITIVIETAQGIYQSMSVGRNKNDKSPKGRLIGYARVSTQQQSLEMQFSQLKAAGVEDHNIHHEKISALANKRPALDEALRSIRRGDTFVVYKLDRLGRDLPDLINRMDDFAKNGIMFKSISEGISIDLCSCTPAQRLQVNMIASLAQFEVDLDRERTTHGIQAALARGVKVGAKEKITEKQMDRVMKLRDQGKSQSQIAKEYKVTPQTIYRRIKKREEDIRLKKKPKR